MTVKSNKPPVAEGSVTLADDGTLLVSGSFDYQSVIAARESGVRMICSLSGSPCRIDLSRVTGSNSVFMALLLSWLRLCESRNLMLELTGAPGPLLAMARISGLDVILPFTDKLPGAGTPA